MLEDGSSHVGAHKIYGFLPLVVGEKGKEIKILLNQVLYNTSMF